MKNILKNFKKLPVQTRVEYVFQALLYILVAPRAFEFFYGSVSGVALWQRALIGLAFMVMFAANYVVALVLMKNAESRERWALFFLSFVLVPVPLAIASKATKKLENVWASMLGAFVVYLVAQFAVSYLFSGYIYLIDRLVG